MLSSLPAVMVALAAIVAPFTFATMVPTPGGLRPQANVRPIPVGGRLAHVGKDIHVIAANGTVVHVVYNATAPTPVPEKREASGWIAATEWVSPSGSLISSMTSSWPVPPVPATWNNQLLYLFNSFFAFNDAIIQPVLQYGVSPAGGGQYWSVASWYVYTNGAFHTNLVNVTVGQVLTGAMSLVNQTSATTFDYSSQFNGIPNSGFIIANSQLLPGASETLEAYGVTKKSDYPTGSTVFSNINLKLTTGTPSLKWSIVSDTTDGHVAQVNVDGATNGKVTIVY